MRAGRVSGLVSTIVLSLVGTGLAHPGHGTTDPLSVTHYVSEPVHVAPLLALVAGTAVALGLVARRFRGFRS